MSNNSNQLFQRFEEIRFSKDIKSLQTLNDTYFERKINNNLFEDNLEISDEITPHLSKSIKKVIKNLNIESLEIKFFVHASAEIQANCIAASRNKCFISFSSALINLFDENEFCFVIGHELGHFLLGHHDLKVNDNDNFNFDFIVNSRAKEISVDRIGLIASRNLNASISAMIKTMSGLNSIHLKINVSKFLSQLNKLNTSASSDNIYSTHPPIVLRSRALLWFSTINKFENFDKSDLVSLKNIDKKIVLDLDKFLDNPIKEKLNEYCTDVKIWLTGKKIINIGKFSKKHQEIFAEEFGKDNLNKFKKFIGLFSNKKVEGEIELKLAESLSLIKNHFPESYENKITEINSNIEKLFSSEC